MIHNTVFILGAGASRPYGFPSGRELREQICSDHIVDCQAFLGANARIKEANPQEIGKAEDFVDTFHKSSIKSIDLFLARNPEFSNRGKRAIIFRILKAEQESGFREETPHKHQDWYSWLFERLTEELVRKEDYIRFSENNVSFITFNYDRSLEHFLYESMLNSFNGVGTDKVIEQVNTIGVFHVYGKVAPLEWQSGVDSVEYGMDLRHTNVEELRKNLRIVYEQGLNPELEKAQEIIKKAGRIFFLGFGYAIENLDALNIPETLRSEHAVFGTALGLSERERKIVESGLKHSAERVTLEDMDCLTLLRRYL